MLAMVIGGRLLYLVVTLLTLWFVVLCRTCWRRLRPPLPSAASSKRSGLNKCWDCALYHCGRGIVSSAFVMDFSRGFATSRCWRHQNPLLPVVLADSRGSRLQYGRIRKNAIFRYRHLPRDWTLVLYFLDGGCDLYGTVDRPTSSDVSCSRWVCGLDQNKAR